MDRDAAVDAKNALQTALDGRARLPAGCDRNCRRRERVSARDNPTRLHAHFRPTSVGLRAVKIAAEDAGFTFGSAVASEANLSIAPDGLELWSLARDNSAAYIVRDAAKADVWLKLKRLENVEPGERDSARSPSLRCPMSRSPVTELSALG